MRLSDLMPELRALIDEILKDSSIKLVEMSCHSDEGVMDLKTAACDALLAHRVETKISGNKINSVINRIHVAVPKARDDIDRAPHIPEGVMSRKRYDKDDPDRIKLERDVEKEEGGAGVYNLNIKSSCLYPLVLCLSCHLQPFDRRKLHFGQPRLEE